MRTLLLKSFAVGGLSLIALAAQAHPVLPLPVQNLHFNDFTGGGCAPKAIFSSTNVADWTGGTGLISIDAPGTATKVGICGNAYSVWGPFADPPPGGNFIQADGNPADESSFNQTITGLTVGDTYTLSFWQAAGQQGPPDLSFSGATTEQWKVFFGSGSFSVDCSTNPCTTSTSGLTTEYDTALMNTPTEGVHAWEQVSLNVVATAGTDTLSFLAWGDNGSTTNLPPTVFLAGVNSQAVPEPGTLALFGIGLLGCLMLRRRTKDVAL